MTGPTTPRRTLLKAMAALPLAAVKLPKAEGQAVKLEAGHHYLIFFDQAAIDQDNLLQSWPQEWKGIDAVVQFIRPAPGKSVAESVAIYAMAEEPKK